MDDYKRKSQSNGWFCGYFHMDFIIIPVRNTAWMRTLPSSPFDHQRGSNWLHNVAPCRNQRYGEILIITGRLIHSAITEMSMVWCPCSVLSTLVPRICSEFSSHWQCGSAPHSGSELFIRLCLVHERFHCDRARRLPCAWAGRLLQLKKNGGFTVRGKSDGKVGKIHHKYWFHQEFHHGNIIVLGHLLEGLVGWSGICHRKQKVFH